MLKSFCCPNCQKKQPVTYLLKQLKTGSVTCTSCKKELKPVLDKTVYKTWHITPIVGVFIAFVPANFFMNEKSFLYRMGFAIIVSLIFFLLYCFWIYKTTYFEVKDNT